MFCAYVRVRIYMYMHIYNIHTCIYVPERVWRLPNAGTKQSADDQGCIHAAYSCYATILSTPTHMAPP